MRKWLAAFQKSGIMEGGKIRHLRKGKTSMPDDQMIIRELLQKYAEITDDPIQEKRREKWRRLNAAKPAAPVLLLRRMAYFEWPEGQCICRDRSLHTLEYNLRRSLRLHTLDDTIQEPWLAMQAERRYHPEGLWGVPTGFIGRETQQHAGKIDAPVKTPEDIDKLKFPLQKFDEEQTRRNKENLERIVGGVLPVHVSREPLSGLAGSISDILGRLLGIDGLMWWSVENPEALHRLSAFLRDGTLRQQAIGEEEGHYTLADQNNQAMPYAEHLEDPDPDSGPVKRERLWNFAASQETQGMSPGMFEDFILQYQLPIMENFALTAYGCCEDMTQRIDALRQIPNLRRVSVTPMSDVARCAEQIGDRYAISYRPSPADMVAYGLGAEDVRKILRRDLEALRANNCRIDITLKDVETIGGKPERVEQFVRICRELSEELWG